MKKFEEKTIQTTTIFNGKVVNLQVDEVLLPDGNHAKRELIKHPGAVAIIPVTKEGKIVFVEQYRKPMEQSLIEIPAGKLEQGEAPESAVIRELEEETGYTTTAIKHVTSFYSSPGFADELLHIYYTDKLEKLTVPVPGDDDEFVEVMELTLDQAKQYVNEKRIHDAKSNYAVLYLEMLEMMKKC